MIPRRGLLWIRYKLLKNFQKRGLAGTMKVGILKIADLVRGLEAGRRHFNAREREFDHEHGVETDFVIHVDELDAPTNVKFASRYSPTPVSELAPFLEGLGIAYEDFIFIDLGSGAGRALLMAADFPFKKIIGVEFSPELHQIAKKNLSNYKSSVQKCSNIELVCMDAMDYVLPPENTVFYMANPFQEPVMKRVMQTLHISLEDVHRQIFIVYYNSIFDLRPMTPFLERVSTGKARGPAALQTVTIYRNKMINNRALTEQS